ncbi:MAG: hypothetical protein HQK64_13425, partial [Desulfamplus sp.]|nr:hypothetical protein [Desulfamplus sp.]
TLIDDNIALKKDMPLIKPALEFMDSGDWEAALDAMKSISRSSPFAHIRIFCKAMSAFYKDNEREMLKAISMIPQDSMLTKITEALKHNPNQSSIDNNKEQKNISNLGMQKLLWSGPFEIYNNLDNIITLSKKENYNDYLQKNILEFATLLMPTHIDSAVQFILETLYQIRCKDEHNFFKMASKLLKSKKELFRAKIYAVFQKDYFISTLEYFKHLDKEFISVEEQKIAKAMLICKMVSMIIEIEDYSFILRTLRANKNITEQFGIKSADVYVAILEMILFAIGIDPKNRLLYDFTLKIPSAYGKEIKNLKEAILLEKCKAFSDSPEPLLELASIYHSKNAYRKAESALQKALELAPHDSRVVDQHVISLLISADKSAVKNNFHLIQKDVDKAKKFDSKRCAILITEKSLFYKIAQTANIEKGEIEAEVSSFALTDKLRCYALLLADIYSKFKIKKRPKATVASRNKKDLSLELEQKYIAPYKSVESLLKDDLATHIGELTSWDILNLMLPIPEEWLVLFNTREILSYFYFNSSPKNPILKKVEDNDLLTLIEKNNQFLTFPILLQELESRIKPQRGRKSKKEVTQDNIATRDTIDSKILQFYALVLKDIVNRTYYPIRYLELLDNIDPNTEKILKEASRKLSKKAFGRLRNALENFEFISPNMIFNSESYPFNFFDDGGFDPFLLAKQLDKLDFDSMPEPVISMFANVIKMLINTNSPEAKEIKQDLDSALVYLENAVDELGLRGKSDQELKIAKQDIQKKESFEIEIKIINLFYKKEAMAKLSREAKILFIE